MAAGKLLECFALFPPAQITVQHFFQRRFQVIERNPAEHLAAHRLTRAETAADKYVRLE